MKFLTLFGLFLVLSCFTLSNGAAVGKPTGQPGCQTEQELAEVYYRHFYLKNAYWICSTLGIPATLGQCTAGYGYLDDVKACVPFSQWYWSPTELPPSQPVVAST
ncbi:uncharacterized protein Dana_GF16453 [Drosophila ananassae]|uniref:Chitin-binding type-2 domain-containing protein n=1 Tax=Drosophila ananassae TaxID=7217 RepID=B3M3C5_DROAN|nr:uncharacterized protein LOC6499249 [Drosophila ananassae]EDV43586.1 uncharacterized protein Dana_GF16453 [Drosophila ananassae]